MFQSVANVKKFETWDQSDDKNPGIKKWQNICIAKIKRQWTFISALPAPLRAIFGHTRPPEAPEEKENGAHASLPANHFYKKV